MALIAGRDRVTYAGLAAMAGSLAQGLHELGVRRGDRVAVWLPNTALWLAVLFACARLGAIVFAVNTRFRSAEMSDVLGRSAARVLVLWPTFRGIDFADIMENADRAALDALSSIVAYGDPSALPSRIASKPVFAAHHLVERSPWLHDLAQPEDGCVVFTTSGTTSRPKFVLHTQQSIVHHACDTARALAYDETGSRVMAVTPFSGVSGFGLPIAALAAGCACVFDTVFDEHATVAAMREHGVTHTHANHAIIQRWLEVVQTKGNFPPLKRVNCGSGIAALMPRAEALGIPLLSIYGSSELQARFSRQMPERFPERRVEAGGFPLSPAAHIRVTDPETRAVLPDGEKGELEVRAPSQMSGYLGDEKATAKTLAPDGYVRTGDFGYLRSDGSFVFETRIGDVLRLSGFLASPAEIESLIASNEAIAACQVVGVETDRGTRAVAFVRLAPQAHFDEERLLQYCANRMARYKVPARIFAIDEFPLTSGSNAPKVVKSALRALAQEKMKQEARGKRGEERGAEA